MIPKVHIKHTQEDESLRGALVRGKFGGSLDRSYGCLEVAPWMALGFSASCSLIMTIKSCLLVLPLTDTPTTRNRTAWAHFLVKAQGKVLLLASTLLYQWRGRGSTEVRSVCAAFFLEAFVAFSISMILAWEARNLSSAHCVCHH
jgi:hypothetical protein